MIEYRLDLFQYYTVEFQKKIKDYEAAKLIYKANAELSQKCLEEDRKTWWKVKV